MDKTICLLCNTYFDITKLVNPGTVKYCIPCLEKQMEERKREANQDFLDEVPE